MFQEVLNGKLHLTDEFDPKSVIKNFYEYFDTTGIDLEHSQWFKNPSDRSMEQIDETAQMQIRQMTSLFFPWRAFLKKDLDPRSGFYDSIYYAFQSDRMFVQYPGQFIDIFTNWKQTSDPCEYFDSGKMDHYDARCRPFYRRAVENNFVPILYGPYANPSDDNKFYALTLSQGMEIDNSLHGVLNHDINLNFRDKYDDLLDANSTYNHYFITTFEGQVMTHSKVPIQSTSDTLTKAEFSETWEILEEEPTHEEAVNFNNTVLPMLESIRDTQLTRFDRFGSSNLVALTPMNVRFLYPASNYPDASRTFVFALATDEDNFISPITDKSDFLRRMIIWICIFAGTFILLILFSIYTFIRISRRALKPIKILNLKVSTLVKTNGELNLEHIKEGMTSYEACKMFEVFSELITTKRFASNNLFEKNDALAIMDYAEAHTVFENNKKAQGICMTNIGHIYYRHKDYEKAANSYKEAAD